MIIRATLISLFFISISGCASLSLYADPDRQIKSWLADDEYQKALDAIVSYPSLPYSEQTIQKQANRYEQRIIKQADQHLKENNWESALKLYEEALKKHPNGKALKRQFKKVSTQQQAILDELSLSMQIEQANWLHRYITIQKLLLQTDPTDRDTQCELKDNQSEAQLLAEKLTQRVEHAMNKGNLQTASRALPAAILLLQNEDSEELATLERKLLQKMNRQQKALDKIELGKQASNLKMVEKALADNDLFAAKTLLDKLPLDDPDAYHLRQQVEQHISERIRLHIRQGNTLYSRGNYEAAIAIWKESQKLSPQHPELSNLIDRAQNVIKTLKKLEEKQYAN